MDQFGQTNSSELCMRQREDCSRRSGGGGGGDVSLGDEMLRQEQCEERDERASEHCDVRRKIHHRCGEHQSQQQDNDDVCEHMVPTEEINLKAKSSCLLYMIEIFYNLSYLE